MIRKYRVVRGFVLPTSIETAPGGVPRRLVADETLELDKSKADRFIRNRVRMGDLEEITAAPAPAAARKE